VPRAALSHSEVEDFRDSLCEVATRLFSQQGYEGVTMRALAAELGCSPMTPYRYFRNKAEIFSAVRSAAFARFAEAQEAAARSSADHRARLRALCRAYVRFALDEPAAYRIMFELDRKDLPPPVTAGDLRAWLIMRSAVGEAVEAGVLPGDPDVLAHLLWSGIHGLVALHLAGMLVLGRDLESLVEAFIEREISRPSIPHGSSEPEESP
jgi:AcrR family transcriptional regulator